MIPNQIKLFLYALRIACAIGFLLFVFQYGFEANYFITGSIADRLLYLAMLTAAGINAGTIWKVV